MGQSYAMQSLNGHARQVIRWIRHSKNEARLVSNSSPRSWRLVKRQLRRLQCLAGLWHSVRRQRGLVQRLSYDPRSCLMKKG